MRIKKINLTEDSIKVYMDSEGNVRSSETGQIIEPQVWINGNNSGATGAGENDPIEGEIPGDGEQRPSDTNQEDSNNKSGDGKFGNSKSKMSPPDFWQKKQRGNGGSRDNFESDGYIYRMHGRTWVQNKYKPGDFREYEGPYNEASDEEIIIEQ